MPPERPYIDLVSDHSKHPDDEQLLQREQVARTLCQLGNYRVILETFAQSQYRALLDEQIARLRSDSVIQQQLLDIKEHLTPAHWEMLTLLELFDSETFQHSIRTYQSINGKLKSTQPIGEYIHTEIDKEGVSRETLLIAALLHDIGKIGLPLKDIILNNTLTDQEWQIHYRLFLCQTKQCSPEEAMNQANEDLALGATQNLRAKDMVPLSYCLTPEQCTALKQSHINPDHTLGQIINIHQDISGAIAEHYGQDTNFIALVANHHERVLSKEEPLPVSTSAIRIATIIHFADVLDAIHANRSYKKGSPFLTTLSILIHQSHDGFIDPILTRLWITDDMQTFYTSQDAYFEALPSAIDHEHADDPDYNDKAKAAIIAKERASLNQINAFLTTASPA